MKRQLKFTKEEMKIINSTSDDDMQLALIGWVLAKRGIDYSEFNRGFAVLNFRHGIVEFGKDKETIQ